MPARTDHDRRDAEDAARAEIRVSVNRYIRRVYEEARAILEKRATDHDGIGPINWGYEGRVAAHQALASWGIPAVPEAAIDGGDDPAIAVRSDSSVDAADA